MIYLIGVNHDAQTGKDFDLSEEFVKALKKIIIESNIKFVFEEWNNFAKKTWKIKKTTVQHLVDQINKKSKSKIIYNYYEPEPEERKRNGIKEYDDLITEHGWNEIRLSSEQRTIIENEILIEYKKRENIWFVKIKDFISENDVIFVCGTKHLGFFNKIRGEGFDTLLIENGYEVEVFPDRFDEWYKK